ncbi:MAG: hypothetical protein AAB426_02645 [Myxococcota bacterium]
MKNLDTKYLFACLGIVALVTFAPEPARAQSESMDEMTKLVAVYELTMPHLEAYGAVMTAMTDWAIANPKEFAAMQARVPKGTTTVEQSIAALDKEPVVKALLDKHRLSARDLVLLPMAAMQAHIAALGEAQGRTFPAGLINPKNVALDKANAARIEAIMTQVAADRSRATGR